MKSYLLRGTALILLVTFPTFSLADRSELTPFPDWSIVKLKKGELACFDLQGAKQARVFQLECEYCWNKLELVTAEVAKLRHLNLESKDVIRNNIRSIEVLETSLEESAELLEDRQARLDSAESLSVFGGALPWVLLAITGAAASGFVLGYSK